MNIFDLTLDLDKHVGVEQWVTVGQGDKSGTTIRAAIFDHGTAFSMAGMSARFLMRQPGGGGYVRDVNVSVSGNTLTYVVNEEQCAGRAGVTNECYFEILQGSSVIASTCRFSMRVLRSVLDGATPAQDWDNAVEQLVRRGEQAVSDAEDAISDAQGAVASANTAVSNANAAATSANNAATNANNKASLANTAATNANTKAGEANTAAGNANTAASNANSAASNANAAASNANEKANLAQQVLDDGIPLMTPNVRGGAKLEQHGGLALRNDALGIGSLVQESDGYARGGLAEVTAKGHAEQVSTTGKNLCPRLPSSSTNGITFATQSDGSVRVSGTAQSLASTNAHFPSAAGVTYTASFSPNDFNGQAYMRIACRDTNGNAIPIDGYGSLVDVFNTPKTFTTPSGTVNVFVYLQVTNGTTINATFYPQLELGSTATAYEPYTGGLPSPRPDWEQPIEVVRGRNLLDIANATFYGGYSNWIVNQDGSLTVTATSATAWSYAYVDIPISGVSSLTLSAISSSASSRIGIECYDANNTRVNAQYSASDSVTSDVPDSTVKARLLFYSRGSSTGSVGDSCTYSNIQLEIGSIAHPYIPYGHVGMETQGKNLVGLAHSPSRAQILGGVTIVSQTDESVTLTSINSTYASLKLYYMLPAGTYTASIGYISLESNTEMSLYKAETAYFIGKAAVGAPKTFTLYEETEIEIRMHATTSSAVVQTVTFSRFQLEKGSTVTEYEPYFHTTTPIPLPSRGWVAGLPDGTADALTLDGAGKCEWELKDDEVTFDGSSDEGTFVHYDSNDGYFAIASSPARAKWNISKRSAKATHFIETSSSSDFYANDGRMFVGNDINFTHRSLSTVADFQTWLSTHPVTILYPLATPVTEDAGYVDMPEIPSDATVTIRELDDLGIKYFIDDSILVYGRQMYQRAHSEYADRLQALEEAVADLVTGA